MCCCRQMDMIMTESQAVMKTSLGDLITLTEKVVSFAQALNERSFVSHICTGTRTALAPTTSALIMGSPLPHLHRDWGWFAIGCWVTI